MWMLQLDFSRQYWTDVFDPFLEAYAEVRAVAQWLWLLINFGLERQFLVFVATSSYLRDIKYLLSTMKLVFIIYVWIDGL